jgi:UDP-glucose 4-epimerase
MLEHLLPTLQPPSRVVVVGGAGFVGGAIAARLARENVPCLPLGRAELDLLAADAAERFRALLVPGDAVVTAAAIAPCKDIAMLVDNMRMVRALVGGLADAPISHVVNISSDAVYADEPLPLTETSPAAPTSLHGVMHLARELALLSALKVPIAMLRPTLIYGSADPHNGYGPNRFRRLAAAGQEILLFGEGEERRDHVAIDDMAEIAVRVLMRRSRGILNVASGDVHSFRAVAEMTVALAPRPVPIRGTPRNGPMPHNGYRPFDNSASRAAFPDFRYTQLQEGLRRAAS